MVYKLTKFRVIDVSVVKLTLEDIIRELREDPEALLIKQIVDCITCIQ